MTSFVENDPSSSSQQGSGGMPQLENSTVLPEQLGAHRDSVAAGMLGNNNSERPSATLITPPNDEQSQPQSEQAAAAAAAAKLEPIHISDDEEELDTPPNEIYKKTETQKEQEEPTKQEEQKSKVPLTAEEKAKLSEDLARSKHDYVAASFCKKEIEQRLALVHKLATCLRSASLSSEDDLDGIHRRAVSSSPARPLQFRPAANPKRRTVQQVQKDRDVMYRQIADEKVQTEYIESRLVAVQDNFSQRWGAALMSSSTVSLTVAMEKHIKELLAEEKRLAEAREKRQLTPEEAARCIQCKQRQRNAKKELERLKQQRDENEKEAKLKQEQEEQKQKEATAPPAPAVNDEDMEELDATPEETAQALAKTIQQQDEVPPEALERQKRQEQERKEAEEARKAKEEEEEEKKENGPQDVRDPNAVQQNDEDIEELDATPEETAQAIAQSVKEKDEVPESAQKKLDDEQGEVLSYEEIQKRATEFTTAELARLAREEEEERKRRREEQIRRNEEEIEQRKRDEEEKKRKEAQDEADRRSEQERKEQQEREEQERIVSEQRKVEEKKEKETQKEHEATEKEVQAWRKQRAYDDMLFDPFASSRAKREPKIGMKSPHPPPPQILDREKQQEGGEEQRQQQQEEEVEKKDNTCGDFYQHRQLSEAVSPRAHRARAAQISPRADQHSPYSVLNRIVERESTSQEQLDQEQASASAAAAASGGGNFMAIEQRHRQEAEAELQKERDATREKKQEREAEDALIQKYSPSKPRTIYVSDRAPPKQRPMQLFTSPRTRGYLESLSEDADEIFDKEKTQVHALDVKPKTIDTVKIREELSPRPLRFPSTLIHDLEEKGIIKSRSNSPKRN